MAVVHQVTMFFLVRHALIRVVAASSTSPVQKNRNYSLPLYSVAQSSVTTVHYLLPLSPKVDTVLGSLERIAYLSRSIPTFAKYTEVVVCPSTFETWG